VLEEVAGEDDVDGGVGEEVEAVGRAAVRFDAGGRELLTCGLPSTTYRLAARMWLMNSQ
jgi:hypothetical protein